MFHGREIGLQEVEERPDTIPLVGYGFSRIPCTQRKLVNERRRRSELAQELSDIANVL